MVIDRIPLTPNGKVDRRALLAPEADEAVPGEGHYNQAMLFTLRHPIEDEVLAEALQALADHHDILRARYEHRSGTWHQHIEPASGDAPLECIDLAKIPADRRGDALTTHADRIQSSLDINAGPGTAVPRGRSDARL